MQYRCGHCAKVIVDANGFINLETHCQYCGALNIFPCSPVAIWHRPPLDRERCSAENCSSRSTTRQPFDLAHLVELFQLQKSQDEVGCISRT
jgi:hypothetical protein